MKTFNEFLTEAYKAPALTPQEVHQLHTTKSAKFVIGMLSDEWKLVNGPHGQTAFFAWCDSVLDEVGFKDVDRSVTELKHQMTASWSLK